MSLRHVGVQERESPALFAALLRKRVVVLGSCPKNRADPGSYSHREGAQKVTRTAPGKTFAPPAFAASAPKTARKMRDVAATRGTISLSEAKMTHRSGMTAPTANAAADAKAA